MSHELLHVVEHANSLGLLYRWKVVEELCQWTAVFQIVQ